MADYKNVQVPLQTDTLTPIVGGGPRTVPVSVTVDGVSTQMLMQVVCIADPAGNIYDQLYDPKTHIAILNELRQIRVLLAEMLGVPALFGPIDGVGQENPPM